MIKFVKARTSVLAIFLAILSIGYTYAQSKVVVVPLGGDEIPGISEYEIISELSAGNVLPGAVLSKTTLCPSGKKAIGGGFSSLTGNTRVIANRPSTIGDGWRIDVQNLAVSGGSIPVIYSQRAICAKVS